MRGHGLYPVRTPPTNVPASNLRIRRLVEAIPRIARRDLAPCRNEAKERQEGGARATRAVKKRRFRTSARSLALRGTRCASRALALHGTSATWREVSFSHASTRRRSGRRCDES